MKTYDCAKEFVHDASGIENPYLWLWEKVNGIYYPAKLIES